MTKLKTPFPFVLSVELPLLFFLGFHFYGSPSMPPDFATPWRSVFGAFLIFLGFAGGVYAAGRVAVASFPPMLARVLAIPVGLGLAALLAAGLGFAGLLDQRGRWVALALLCFAGFLSDLRRRREPARKRNPAPLRLEYRLAIAVISLLVLSVAALSFRVYPFWDPLWYHLVGPRLWFEAGRMVFTPNHLIAYNTGSWDFLYVYGPLFLGARGGGGLPISQLFGQWIHSMLGFGGSAFVLFQLFRFFSRDRLHRALATFSALGLPMVFFTSTLAKNDWGVILWASSGVLVGYFYLGRAGGRERVFTALLGGFLVGLAMSTKWTVAYAVLPLVAEMLWRARKLPRAFLLRAAGLAFAALACACAPIWIRNWLGTENPFFPTSSGAFPATMLGPTWITNMTLMQGKFLAAENLLPARIHSNLLEFFEQHIFYYLFPFCPVAFYAVKKTRRLFPLWLALVVMLLVFFASSGIYAVPRWLALGTILFGTVTIFCLAEFLLWATARVRGSLPWPRVIGACLLAVLCLESPIFLSLVGVARLPAMAPVAQQVLDHPHGPALDWVRRHATPEEGVAFLQETRVYYVSDRHFARIWDDPSLDRAISTARDVLAVLRVIEGAGYRYLIDSDEFIDRIQREDIVRKLRLSYGQIPEAMVFESPRSRVFDIRRWISEIENIR